MKIGCQMAFNDFTSPGYIAEAAQHVEEKGFHQFWVQNIRIPKMAVLQANHAACLILSAH
jgi:hypothetical protein